MEDVKDDTSINVKNLEVIVGSQKKKASCNLKKAKAYYWSEKQHFVDQMDKPVPDSKYEDALSNYIIHILF